MQRVISPDDGTESWTVLADDWAPVELFLAHLTDQGRSPHTVKAHAHDLKDYFAYLEGRRAGWRRLRCDFRRCPMTPREPQNRSTWPAWATERVKVVDYDPSWAARGEQERQFLQELLAPWLHGHVEHVGSTAIPGLAAKPILDLQAPVQDLAAAEQIAPLLAAHRWHYVNPDLDQRPYRRFFVKVIDGRRAAHLHLMPADSPRWHQQLAFRDALRTRPELVRAYAQLKDDLAASHPDDREAYTAGKQRFVDEVLARDC